MSAESVSVGDGARGSRPSPAARWGSRLSPLLREPLVHFLAIGSLIFAANAVLAPSAGKDRLIEVTPEVRQSIVEVFRVERHRDPTPTELAQLTDLWVLNEITYREALAQGLDKGDEMIRERIMQKMRLLVFSNTTVADPSEAELQEWLDRHRARYDVAETLSFFAVPVGGPEAGGEAEEILRQIESGEEPEALRLRARVFAKRPRPTVENAFGKDFADRLVGGPRGRWQALSSASGWHIVRLDNVVPGRAVALAEVREQVFGDLKQERIRTAAVATIREMGRAYIIRRGDQP
jgi:parvulin-like peptidyl-prolyl cis-trans isomerase-like protein